MVALVPFPSWQDASPLCLQTFGECRLFYRGSVVECRELAGRGPAMTLLKVLVCSGPNMDSHFRPLASTAREWERHQCARKTLGRVMWPDEHESIDIARCLRTAKSVINTSLRGYTNGADVVESTCSSENVFYFLNSGVMCLDADLFETLEWQASLAEGNGQESLELWERAYALIQGEFLPLDYACKWSRGRRARLQSKYRHCLHRLAYWYREGGRVTEALSLLHPYVLAHVSDEDALCLLMPLLAEQGRHAEALQLAERYEQVMRNANKTPAESVLRLSAAVRQGHDAALEQVTQAVARKTHMFVPSLRAVEVVATTLAPSSPGGQGPGWFDLKRASIQALVALWSGRAACCAELQAAISQELSMFEEVRSLFPPQEYPLSRRAALVALAAVSKALISSVQQGQYPPQVLEEFLPQCAASLTACHQLMQGQDFFTAGEMLAQFMPALEQIAHQPSRYQQTAAYLAAQGCMMRAILAWHRLDVAGRIAQYSKAVEYSRIAEDANELVIMLAYLGHTYAQVRDVAHAMPFYQEAWQVEKQASPLARAKLSSFAAFAHAQLGEEHEARTLIDAAHATWPINPLHDPALIIADGGQGSLYMLEGWVRHELSKPRDPETLPDKGQLNAAWNAYTFTINNPAIVTTERIRVEVANHQAAAALAMRDKERFEQYFLIGASGAVELGSPKRKQEAMQNWKGAVRLWPGDARIADLAEVLM